MSWDILPKNILQYFLTKLKDKLDAISAAIPTKVSQLTNDSGYITSSGSCNYATSAGSATDSTKVAKAGDTMSGRLNFSNFDKAQINFRTNHASYDGTISYQTAGNEALVHATKNEVTSIIFVNGEDSITNASNNRWQSLTPGLQIKNNKVAIGKLISNGTTPSHALDVVGTVNISAAHDTPFRITRNNNTGACYQLFANKNGGLGYYAVGSDKKPYFEPYGGSDVRIALMTDIPRKAYGKYVQCTYYNDSELHGSFTVDNANDVAAASPSDGRGLTTMSYYQCYKYSGTTWVIVVYGNYSLPVTRSANFNVVIAPA